MLFHHLPKPPFALAKLLSERAEPAEEHPGPSRCLKPQTHSSLGAHIEIDQPTRGVIIFVESLVESTPMLRTRSRVPALLSLAVQAAIIAACIAVPLLHPEVLHPAQLRLSVLAPPPLPAPKPPPPPPRVVTATNASRFSTPTAPTPILSTISQAFRTDEPAVDAPVLALGSPLGTANSLAVAIANTAPPAVFALPAANAAPTRISQGVIAGLLIAPITPVYPAIARTVGVQGTVVVEAVISKTGRIESARAVKGPILLQGAALDAVRAARYRPYLLNGEPTEVETTININFRMGG